MKFSVRKRRTAPAVIIVALIDVLVVLLIFLMVTTTFKQQPLLKLAHAGPVLLSGDLYHVRSDRPHDGASARLMRVNSSRSESLASVDRIETLLKNLHARLVIQHDPEDIKSLPASPAYLD